MTFCPIVNKTDKQTCILRYATDCIKQLFLRACARKTLADSWVRASLLACVRARAKQFGKLG